MKSDGEIMEILAAYDLTGSLRATAELTGCSHHTVANHVQARDAARTSSPTTTGSRYGPRTWPTFSTGARRLPVRIRTAPSR
jgi:hypothetical protein